MQSIMLTSDQLRKFQSAGDVVQLIDSSGNLLGNVYKVISLEVVADALKRSQSDGPWYTTEEVLGYLNSLEEC